MKLEKTTLFAEVWNMNQIAQNVQECLRNVHPRTITSNTVLVFFLIELKNI